MGLSVFCLFVSWGAIVFGGEESADDLGAGGFGVGGEIELGFGVVVGFGEGDPAREERGVDG